MQNFELMLEGKSACKRPFSIREDNIKVVYEIS
jgi:hypothetical protein